MTAAFDPELAATLVALPEEMEWDAAAHDAGDEHLHSEYADGWNNAMDGHARPLATQLAAASLDLERWRAVAEKVTADLKRSAERAAWERRAYQSALDERDALRASLARLTESQADFRVRFPDGEAPALSWVHIPNFHHSDIDFLRGLDTMRSGMGVSLSKVACETLAIGIWLTNVLWMRRSRRTRERWDLQAKEMRQSDDAAYKRLHDQALSDATALDAARRENLDLLAECVNFKRLLMQDPVIRARADAFNWSRGDDDGDN